MAKLNFTMRMDTDIRQQLNVLAVDEHRTASSMVEVLILRAMKARAADVEISASSRLNRETGPE